MRQLARPLLACVVLAASSALPAHARDICFALPGIAGSLVFVAKDLTVPRRNKCKPVSGFSAIEGWLLDGTACTEADGTSVKLAFAGHPLVPGPTVFQMGCTIPLPTLTGGTCRGTYHAGSDVIGATSSIDLQSCVTNVP